MPWITIVIRFLMMIGWIRRSTIERGRKRMRRDEIAFVTVDTGMNVVAVAMSVSLRLARGWSTRGFRDRRNSRCNSSWTGVEI